MTLQNIYIQVLLIMRKELCHRWHEAWSSLVLFNFYN